MLIELVNAGVYVWDTRSLTPVGALNNGGEDGVTKKNTKSSSGSNTGSTRTKNTYRQRRKVVLDRAAS